MPGTEFGVEDILMLQGWYDQIWEDGVGVLFFILPTMATTLVVWHCMRNKHKTVICRKMMADWEGSLGLRE